MAMIRPKKAKPQKNWWFVLVFFFDQEAFQEGSKIANRGRIVRSKMAKMRPKMAKMRPKMANMRPKMAKLRPKTQWQMKH